MPEYLKNMIVANTVTNCRVIWCKKAAISKHLTNIFNSGELDKNAVVSKMETTASDGKTYDVLWYNLDAIIAVGYRVNFKRATAFRI